VALIGLAVCASCAPRAQPLPAHTEVRSGETRLAAPAPLPPPLVSSAAPAALKDAPAAEDDPGMCPLPTANSAQPALREVASDAVAPDPALLRRLTPAQRAELTFLGALCETAVTKGDDGVEVGCSCCPPFDECGPVRGARPRGDADGVFQVATRTQGAFTKPGVQELAITFDGCEPHAANYGGTLLYRKLNDGWASVGYASGVHPHRCQPYRLREGRDVLICQWADGHQTGHEDVYVYDFAPPDRACRTDLVTFPDDSMLCEGEPGKPLTWSVLDRVGIQYLDRDGTLDLRIEGRERSGLPSQRFKDACTKTLARDDVPSPAELAAEHALLGPLKHLVYDFISDGTRFHPLSDPRAP